MLITYKTDVWKIVKITVVMYLIILLSACGDSSTYQQTCQQEIEQQVRDARYDRASCIWCHELNGHEGDMDCIPCHSFEYRVNH